MKLSISIFSIAMLLASPAAFGNAALYAKHCSSCHGKDGRGDTKQGKKLKVKDLTAEQGKLSDAQIAKSMTEGVREGGKVRMKAIKDLGDADVKAIIKYVRTLK